MNIDNLRVDIQMEIEDLTVKIEQIRRIMNSVERNLKKNPKSINSLGELQSLGPMFDANCARLTVYLNMMPEGM